MSLLERAFASARARKSRVLLPEIDDARICEAAARLRAEGLAEPVAPEPAAPLESYVPHLLRNRPGLKESLARRMLEKPLIRAAAMLAAGEADCLIAGAVAPTRRVIEAAQLGVGMAQGIATPSSFFAMLLPDGREFIFADCALNVAPDAAELADIARASARTARALTGRSELALLSYSTGRSGTGPGVDLLHGVTDTLRAEGLSVQGPVQGDAALNSGIATRKGLAGGGQANVLIFPSLDAGNIAYKLCQELAGAQALGPVLQGFARPVSDLSRGASSDDIIAITAITLALASVPETG
ncbi:MAG: phosphate acetyltransferase [Pararhodobacter sp.]|nr:phosphate acetyltransferase [Pararhodobacter sp.]